MIRLVAVTSLLQLGVLMGCGPTQSADPDPPDAPEVSIQSIPVAEHASSFSLDIREAGVREPLVVTGEPAFEEIRWDGAPGARLTLPVDQENGYMVEYRCRERGGVPICTGVFPLGSSDQGRAAILSNDAPRNLTGSITLEEAYGGAEFMGTLLLHDVDARQRVRGEFRIVRY